MSIHMDFFIFYSLFINFLKRQSGNPPVSIEEQKSLKFH